MEGTIKDIEQIGRSTSKGIKYLVYWGFVPLIIGLAAYDFLKNRKNFSDYGNPMWRDVNRTKWYGCFYYILFVLIFIFQLHSSYQLSFVTINIFISILDYNTFILT